MLLDSNIIIDAVEAQHAFLDRWVEDPEACLATVSRVEILGYRSWHLLDHARRDRTEVLIGALIELPMDEQIVLRAIALRRQKKMSLADAIIAGTAVEHQLPLVTRNVKDFAAIPGLQIINPFSP